MKHIELLCSISELSWVFEDSTSITGFLDKIVTMTSSHMESAVCSIYLYDKSRDILILTATYGLNSDHVGKLTLKPGEGITGIAFKELRPICENQGSSHPGYKHVHGLDEEHYDAFLAVPITRGIERIGVLVIQRESGRSFLTSDITALRAVTNQLANIIESARELISLKASLHNSSGAKDNDKPVLVFNEKVVRGTSASSGFALGLVRKDKKNLHFESLLKNSSQVHHDLDAFTTAVKLTKDQLAECQKSVENQLEDAASLIFAAHLMMLQDDLFYLRIVDKIKSGSSADTAILSVSQQLIALFSGNENRLIREKSYDIKDLALRLVQNLPGMAQQQPSAKGHVIVARELLPSDILVLASEGAAGIVLIEGGATSHLSILARSLRLPMIFADEPRLLDVSDDSRLLLDADTGNIYINPDDTVISLFSLRNKAQKSALSSGEFSSAPVSTTDNKPITLLVNINLLVDVKEGLRLGCGGVGLYRTEFPFMIRTTFPTEEEQLVIYRKLVLGMQGKPVTFRTLDIGGDKVLSYYDHFTEQNPFLGLRSIRFALTHPEIFRQQLRAILRAGHDADLRIMFPMISTVEELTEATAMVEICKNELASEHIVYNAHPKIGMMVEIPAVVEIIDVFAKMVDFFSIGTNDLVQYTLAVDRTNEKVAQLYCSHHPAVLRSLNRVVSSAKEHGIMVSVCGDMAHQECYIPFLLGIGIESLSVDAAYLPVVRSVISRTSLTDANLLAQRALSESSLLGIRKLIGIDK